MDEPETRFIDHRGRYRSCVRSQNVASSRPEATPVAEFIRAGAYAGNEGPVIRAVKPAGDLIVRGQLRIDSHRVPVVALPSRHVNGKVVAEASRPCSWAVWVRREFQ